MDRYITITGFKHYYGAKPFRIGNLIRCRKEPENGFDHEAIRCSLPMVGTVGYIANSPETVAGGTMSAGRIYDHLGDQFYVRVMFTSFTKIICKIEFSDPRACEEEVKRQMAEDDEDDWGNGEACNWSF